MKNYIKLPRVEVSKIWGGTSPGGTAAASCSAKCHSGTDITCSGHTCAAQDYVHCSAADRLGNNTIVHCATP